ncbi:MAG TPA: PAS domain-containing sensor histidine kinase [Gemmatimonadaceae bacterium]|jgi:PAS domain S-box-containing protein|nr:PAS domain-containing sensor histidine kinase [Gemmatimonadaceae bacterium]
MIVLRVLIAVAALALLWALHLLRVRVLTLRERRSREVLDTLPAMAFINLPDGTRSFVNQWMRNYNGLNADEVVVDARRRVVHPDDIERVTGIWQRAFATGEAMEYELRIRGSDGTYRWFFSRVVPVKDQHGQVTKWCGIATDIEDRKQAEHERERLHALEAELAHINRVSTMGELTASLAHEIAQPITAMVTNASAALRWLGRDQPDLTGVSRSVKRIVEDGARANELIERVRSMYKKVPVRHEPSDMNDGIRDVLSLIQYEAERKSVSIRAVLTPNLPPMTADRVQMRQVLLNLTLNAIEAMKDSGGELTVSSALDDPGHLRCSVSDTGVGLPAEHGDRIFDAFVTTKPTGSGMGLAICKSIVESHGGRLWATANEGPGATFHFTLPTATVAASRDAQPSGHAYQLGQ